MYKLYMYILHTISVCSIYINTEIQENVPMYIQIIHICVKKLYREKSEKQMNKKKK